MHIQRATSKDIPALQDLVAQYWAFERLPEVEPARLAGQLERILNSPALGAGWIATDNATPIGYLIAVYVFSLEHLGITAEIDELFVMPARRHTGIGAMLLQAAEAESRRNGCTNISLQLSRENLSARKFYHRHGYAERLGYELLEKNLGDA